MYVPLHHERVFLLHGELRVDLDGIIFILQLQQLLPALLRHQLAVINDICEKKSDDTIITYEFRQVMAKDLTVLVVLTVTRRAALAVDGELA